VQLNCFDATAENLKTQFGDGFTPTHIFVAGHAEPAPVTRHRHFIAARRQTEMRPGTLGESRSNMDTPTDASVEHWHLQAFRQLPLPAATPAQNHRNSIRRSLASGRSGHWWVLGAPRYRGLRVSGGRESLIPLQNLDCGASALITLSRPSWNSASANCVQLSLSLCTSSRLSSTGKRCSPFASVLTSFGV